MRKTFFYFLFFYITTMIYTQQDTSLQFKIDPYFCDLTYRFTCFTISLDSDVFSVSMPDKIRGKTSVINHDQDFIYSSAYTFDYKHGLPFIVFMKPVPYYKEAVTWSLFDEGVGRLLLYTDDAAIVYSLREESRSEFGKTPAGGGFWTFGNLNDYPLDILFLENSEDIYPIWDNYYTATSSLSEGGEYYEARDLRKLWLPNPWCEGVEGYGIGETITIEFNQYHKPGHVTYKDPALDPADAIHISHKEKTLYLSNGYISTKKPYLYNYNGRVKRMRVYNEAKEYEQFVDIKDTPHLQKIHVPAEVDDLVHLEIVDIYEGSKWEDTCINFIVNFTKIPEYEYLE